MIRVVVADDQALVRGGFRLILQTQPDIEVVGEAADGREAVARAREQRPDVVLMDIRMPGMDGLEATRRLMTTQNPPRVLMLTTFDLDEYVYDALRVPAPADSCSRTSGPSSSPTRFARSPPATPCSHRRSHGAWSSSTCVARRPARGRRPVSTR